MSAGSWVSSHCCDPAHTPYFLSYLHNAVTSSLLTLSVPLSHLYPSLVRVMVSKASQQHHICVQNPTVKAIQGPNILSLSLSTSGFLHPISPLSASWGPVSLQAVSCRRKFSFSMMSFTSSKLFSELYLLSEALKHCHFSDPF